MAKLEDALKRLDRAVTRLEKAAGRIGEDNGADNRALAAVKADYAALLETTEGVSARLDAAILRLDRMLEA